MKRILELLASILEYPGPGLAAQVLECERQAAAAGLPTEHLGEFGRFVAETPREALEEIYAASFDLSDRFSPYVGYHLFGDGYARSAFLVGLLERYGRRGFRAERELADHLSVMLRFVASCEEDALREEIVTEALLPVVEKLSRDMTGSSPGEGCHYLAVMRTLEEALRRTRA